MRAVVVALVALLAGCGNPRPPEPDASDVAVEPEVADAADRPDTADADVADTAECTPGQARICYARNMWGTCEGTQICNFMHLWDVCSAPIPAEEICDRMDNDCDGAIDEGFACGGAPDVDYCVLQWPASTMTSAGVMTETIYGRIYEAGVTEAAGEPIGVVAELGVGPAGSDPTTSPDWTYTPAAYNMQFGNDDEYMADLTPAMDGTFAYTYRFSLDAGTSYTYCDLDGFGSNPGLTFDPAMLGMLTVTP